MHVCTYAHMHLHAYKHMYVYVFLDVHKHLFKNLHTILHKNSRKQWCIIHSSSEENAVMGLEGFSLSPASRLHTWRLTIILTVNCFAQIYMEEGIGRLNVPIIETFSNIYRTLLTNAYKVQLFSQVTETLWEVLYTARRLFLKNWFN